MQIHSYFDFPSVFPFVPSISVHLCPFSRYRLFTSAIDWFDLSIRFFFPCKANRNTSRVHRICDTFLRPPYLQSQASTNTRDNKLICQFLDFLTFWKRSTSRQRYHYSETNFHNPGCHEHTRLKRNLNNITGKERKERAISSTSFANTTNRHSKEVASNGRTETKQQDSKDQLPPAKDLSRPRHKTSHQPNNITRTPNTIQLIYWSTSSHRNDRVYH